MTLGETFARIRSDYIKMSQCMGIKLTLSGALFLFLSPSIMGITLYRFSHYFHVRGFRRTAWFLWLINVYVVGLDIIPSSVIGHSFYIGHPNGTAVSARIGDNVSLYFQAGIGGGRGKEDIGGGEGLPVIGDNVVVGARGTILGPVRVGSNSVVGACSLVIDDVPDNTVVCGNPARPVRESTEAAVS